MFPEALRAARLAAGLTQENLGELALLSQMHIAHYEAGRRSPSLKNLVRLANALGVKLDDLVISPIPKNCK